MSELKGMLCIIVAGYEEEMTSCFLGTNIGLKRRFAKRWVLQRASERDIIDIFSKMLTERDTPVNFYFSGARRIFNSKFTVHTVAEKMRILLLALNQLNALPNQTADIEKIAGSVYELLSLIGAENVTDEGYLAIVNSFISESSATMEILNLNREYNMVDIISDEGNQTRLQF